MGEWVNLSHVAGLYQSSEEKLNLSLKKKTKRRRVVSENSFVNQNQNRPSDLTFR